MNDKNAKSKFRYLKLQKREKLKKVQEVHRCWVLGVRNRVFIAIVKSCQSLSSFFLVSAKKTRHIQGLQLNISAGSAKKTAGKSVVIRQGKSIDCAKTKTRKKGNPPLENAEYLCTKEFS
jgi:hypothetical protein